MQWEGKVQGGGVEDRRGLSPGAAAGGVGGIGALILGAIVYFVSGDARLAQQAVNVAKQHGGGAQQVGPGIDDRTKKFADAMYEMNNRVWGEQFPKVGVKYAPPGMVLFSEAVSTRGCGNAPSAVGPFYCPADKTVYLDPTFFDELEKKLGGSKADFSQAYVIAHEVGHHVQNLLGYNARLKQYEGREGKNAGIRLELQADYLAGVWAHHAEQKYRILEAGDVESALKTARAIGDNRIMEKAGRWASPESFTHGTDAQRLKYFKQGLDTGKFDKPTLDHFFDPNVNPLKL